ncbi:MAG: hypothetical protein R6W84_04380 [Promethearchaeia archaeon]
MKKILGHKIDNVDDENLLIYTILFLALILGAAVRFNFINGTEFPMNDGGFFYQMTEDLVKNKFKIPKFTEYNQGNIPYAYPPLTFYIVGLLHKISNVKLFILFHFMPAVISTVTIIVFFLFSKLWFDNRFYQSLSTLFFALTPRSFEWFVMGGGVTRSFGFLFSIIAIKYILIIFLNQKQRGNIFLAAIFSGLTLLSHPVTSLFLIFNVFMGLIYFQDRKQNFYYCSKFGILTVLIISPWALTILTKHGLSPFLSALSTGHVHWFEIKNLITLNFGFENPYYLSIIGVLALIGAFNFGHKHSVFLISAIILGYCFIPRGGVDLLTIYLAILATLGLKAILGFWVSDRKEVSTANRLMTSKRARAFFLFLIVYLFLGSYTYKYVNGKINLQLEKEDIQAMNWICEHTDKEANILLYPSSEVSRFWWDDFLAEWLPAITDRVSVTTVQGYEWIPSEFIKRVNRYSELRFCEQQGSECVESWANKYKIDFDYLMLGDKNVMNVKADDFVDNTNYEIKFENEKIIIFKYALDGYGYKYPSNIE